MAYSLLALPALRRQIERLRDPRALDGAELAVLDGLLTVDELEEVERRRREIYAFNKFMALPVDVGGRLDLSEDDKRSIQRMNSAIEIANLEYEGQLRRLATVRARIAKKQAAGIRNPTAYSEDRRLERFHSEYGPSLIDSVRRGYENLTAHAKLFVEEKTVWTGNDYYPKRVESWENVVWPNHPNARRQAYIEVLTEKLEMIEQVFSGS